MFVRTSTRDRQLAAAAATADSNLRLVVRTVFAALGTNTEELKAKMLDLLGVKSASVKDKAAKVAEFRRQADALSREMAADNADVDAVNRTLKLLGL